MTVAGATRKNKLQPAGRIACVCGSAGGGVACEEMFLGPLRVMGWGQLLKCLFYVVSCNGVTILLLLEIAEICSWLLNCRPPYKYSLASLAHVGNLTKVPPHPAFTNSPGFVSE